MPSEENRKAKENNMSHYDAGGFADGTGQCFVCEKAITGEHWFARVKHGECTVALCSEKCAAAFYKQRLPGLRRFQILEAMRSLQWPRQEEAMLNVR